MMRSLCVVAVLVAAATGAALAQSPDRSAPPPALATFAGIAFVAVTLYVVTRFFVSHYIFRWRTAMNDYYMAHWGKLRRIEGASQRVQEDTMRFSTTVEGLGVSLIGIGYLYQRLLLKRAPLAEGTATT